MKLRLPAVAAAFVAAGALLAPSAFGASTTVVISQVAFRGPQGGNDEHIQIRNISGSPQAIGGWEIWGASQAGTATGSRAKVPDNVILPAGRSYLFTNTAAAGYSGAVPGDVTYGTGINDSGGLQLRNSVGTVIDAVGSRNMAAPGAAFREGAGLPFPTGANADNTYTFVRKAGGTQDTDDNALDFTDPVVRDPLPAEAACGTDCAPAGPPDPCGNGTTIVRIDVIQSLGGTSNCDGKTVKIHGIVTGVDDLYGSNFDSIFKGDSGIWVQEATHDPGATTSEGIFVSGIRRNAGSPADVIGDEITISGVVDTKFGLVELVPPGVAAPRAQDFREVDLASVATINSTHNALPAAVVIDTATAESQDPATRRYYRSLQGMRVKLPEGIATGGGTTKFHDVYLEPGTTARRLFRKNDPLADTQPWRDAPAEIGVAPDGGAHNPADPRLSWRSDTQVDIDLFDVARNVVGPLTYTFSYYEVMPQLPAGTLNAGEQPTVERGPVDAAYPPAAPAQPPGTFRFASFNVENYFPAGTINDGHLISDADYKAKTDQIVAAIRNFLREPDVIAMQEVAVFDNANALTGLAQALGNYMPYIARNNDERGIAPGFLVKNGTTASNPRVLGQDETYHDWTEGACNLVAGDDDPPAKLFDRAPFALDIRKGDLDITALSNHWASQSHQTACRLAEAEFVRRQASALQAQGRNVLVAGDLNDFEFSAPLARLTQGGVLTNLWSKAPAGLAYSYKFNGHLQTLDHINLTAGLLSRATDMRYVHFDNDYYERPPDDHMRPDGTGVSDHDPPLATFNLAGTSASGDVTGTVPATLSLTIDGPASFMPFRPASAADYLAATTATVTSTAGDAQLSVLDASANAPGRLVNGTYALTQPLQVKADDGAFAPLPGDNGPLALKSWKGPVSGGSVALGFKQSITAGEPLRTGTYGKTLTYTLSTTTP